MHKKDIEKACIDICHDSINMLIPWYLMASYAYYVQDDPILEDSVFDKLAKRIINNWNDIDHFHKDCLNLDMLKAGTYAGEYPSRIKGALDEVRNIYK